jgi:DNA repair protein RecN (Recombination protein N)
MSANAGESLKPMSKVASGGELARIMLAMKNVLAEKDQVPTLIFDEVDAGVSGRAAQKVAAKLVSVSKGKQVFCSCNRGDPRA